MDDPVAYGSNDNLRFLNEKKINPIIKVKRNSVISHREKTRLEIKKSTAKTKDLFKWKKKRRYGHTQKDG